jgi:hypothetical protein
MSFFDLPEEQFSKNSKPGAFKEDPNIYDPDPDKYNGSYKSVFRFIPYLKDKSKSKYTKYTCKIYNPLTQEKLIVDCPSNEEKPSFLWTLDSVIRSLKKEEPDLHAELSKAISRWYTHISPIYIKKDPQRPDLENQIKFLQFRSQIDQCIEQQINPEDVDGLMGIKKVNPYHLLEGKDFLCSVSKKTREFRDWSKCKFMDEITPLVFKVGDKLVAASENEKVIKLLEEFLLKNTPDVSQYLHNNWTEETYSQVASAIVSAIPQTTILEIALQKSKDSKMNALIREKIESKSKSKSSVKLDDLDFSKSLPKKEEKAIEKMPFDEDDEYDNLFNDL